MVTIAGFDLDRIRNRFESNALRQAQRELQVREKRPTLVLDPDVPTQAPITDRGRLIRVLAEREFTRRAFRGEALPPGLSVAEPTGVVGPLASFGPSHQSAPALAPRSTMGTTGGTMSDGGGGRGGTDGGGGSGGGSGGGGGLYVDVGNRPGSMESQSSQLVLIGLAALGAYFLGGDP